MSAVYERVKPKISYNEYSIKHPLAFTLQKLNPDGSVTKQEEQITIEKIRTGGFFGKVIFPENADFVIKTSLPDSWHHLWRTINWNLEEFPAQYEETMAQMEHLSGRIIHTVLPFVSDGKFYSPDSLGYTQLSTGYAQVVEKVSGRPPRYDLEGKNENHEFRQVQHELTELAFNLGLEQVGQIHEDNIYGMANVWRDEENNRWIWLDTIPAIPHRGFVYPFYYFKFHQDVRHRLNNGNMTFNTIHTDKFRSYMNEHRDLFPDDIFNQLGQDLALYELKTKQYDVEAKHRHSIDTTARALAQVMLEGSLSLAKSPITLAKKAAIEPIRTILDKNYRVQPILERLKRAHSNGLLNDEELERANNVIQKYRTENSTYSRDDKILTALLGSYLVSNNIINVLQASIGTNVVLGGQDILSGGEYIGLLQIASYLLRPLITYLIGRKTHTDLRAAAAISWLPFGGFTYAIPAQISQWTGSKSKEIWHQTVRNLITNISSLPIFPFGGLGSQFEGELMERLGKWMEGFVKFED